MHVSTRHRSRSLAVALAAAIALCTGVRAEAQPGIDPLWDHYKVYTTPPFPVPPLGMPLTLADQFGIYNHTALQIEKYMNPTMKQDGNGSFPINDPILHYSWWRITPQPFFANDIVVSNQFGDQPLIVHDAEYLLNPSRKNQPTGLPLLVANHYKCYYCDGNAVNQTVVLTDQFDQWNTVVTFPRWLCNPVNKTDPTGTYPIINSQEHLVCYELTPPDPAAFGASFSDQFVAQGPLDMQPGKWLCVPSLKQHATATNKNTWGRVKQVYR